MLHENHDNKGVQDKNGGADQKNGNAAVVTAEIKCQQKEHNAHQRHINIVGIFPDIKYFECAEDNNAKCGNDLKNGNNTVGCCAFSHAGFPLSELVSQTVQMKKEQCQDLSDILADSFQKKKRHIMQNQTHYSIWKSGLARGKARYYANRIVAPEKQEKMLCNVM